LAAALDHLVLCEEDRFLRVVRQGSEIESLNSTGEMLLEQFRLFAVVVKVPAQPG